MDFISSQEQVIFTFTSYKHYIANVCKILFDSSNRDMIICFDSNNKYCYDGEDFSKAAYPVKAFKLTRVSNKPINI